MLIPARFLASSPLRVWRQTVRVAARARRASGRTAILLATALGATACLESSQAIVWQDADAAPLTLPVSANDSMHRAALDGSLAALSEVRDSVGRRFALGPLPSVPAPNPALGTDSVPADDARCEGSLQARPSARGTVAVWWSQRNGARVDLLSAWRDVGQDGWRGPIVVDSVDVGSTDARDAAEGGAIGCRRPAPGLAVDAVNGFVHVSYALVGPEGPGIFYAHQMDPRAAFEVPLAIVYGERLGVARVASDGDLVVVAYEDPNSGERPRIAVAVSRTAGHLFERRLTVNAGLNPAANPFVVVRGRAMAIGWEEAPPGGGETTYLQRRGVLR